MRPNYPLLIAFAALGCAGNGTFVYKGRILQGEHSRHLLTYKDQTNPPVAKATVVLVVDYKPHKACSYKPTPNAPRDPVTLEASSDGTLSQDFGLMGVPFRDNILSVCVRAAGFEDYEYSVNLEKDPIGGRSAWREQVVFLSPSQANP